MSYGYIVYTNVLLFTSVILNGSKVLPEVAHAQSSPFVTLCLTNTSGIIDITNLTCPNDKYAPWAIEYGFIVDKRLYLFSTDEVHTFEFDFTMKNMVRVDTVPRKDFFVQGTSPTSE